MKPRSTGVKRGRRGRKHRRVTLLRESANWPLTKQTHIRSPVGGRSHGLVPFDFNPQLGGYPMSHRTYPRAFLTLGASRRSNRWRASYAPYSSCRRLEAPCQISAGLDQENPRLGYLYDKRPFAA